jgi:hypothetical protein
MATKKKQQAELAEKPVQKNSGHGGPRPNSGGARPGAGRPAFEPTENERKQVEAFSGYGLPLDQIAVLIRDGISVDTLTTHFSNELVSGKAKANAGVGRTLHQKAMAGDTTAAIWWSKTQMRWRETQQMEHTGKDGAPIAVASVDFKNLSDAELATMQALMTKAKGSEE